MPQNYRVPAYHALISVCNVKVLPKTALNAKMEHLCMSQLVYKTALKCILRNNLSALNALRAVFNVCLMITVYLALANII